MNDDQILGGMDPFRIAVADAPTPLPRCCPPTLPSVSPSGSTGCGARPLRSR